MPGVAAHRRRCRGFLAGDIRRCLHLGRGGAEHLFVLRKRHPDLERPYRTWGYPWVPAAFLVGAIFLLGNYLISEPWIFAADMAVIASGVSVYWFWLRGRHS